MPLKDPVKRREYLYEWRKRRPEMLKAIGRSYYERHRDEIRARRKAQRVARPKHPRALLSPEVRLANHRSAHRRWVIAHRDNMAANERRRRARKRGAQGSHTKQEWMALVARYGGRCAYCGRFDLPLTEDHIVPISRGGTDDISNVVPACRPCNSKKGPRPVEYVRAGGGEAQ